MPPLPHQPLPWSGPAAASSLFSRRRSFIDGMNVYVQVYVCESLCVCMPEERLCLGVLASIVRHSWLWLWLCWRPLHQQCKLTQVDNRHSAYSKPASIHCLPAHANHPPFAVHKRLQPVSIERAQCSLPRALALALPLLPLPPPLPLLSLACACAIAPRPPSSSPPHLQRHPAQHCSICNHPRSNRQDEDHIQGTRLLAPSPPESPPADAQAGPEAEQVRHRGRAFRNGMQRPPPSASPLAARRSPSPAANVCTIDWRPQVQDSGRKGMGRSTAKAHLLG